MKKIIILSLLAVAVFAACDDRETVTVGEQKVPNLSGNTAGKSVVITSDKLAQPFDTFKWSEADFGFQSADASYELLIDLAENNFESAISLGITDTTTLTVLNDLVNKKLITLGATPGRAVEVNFRVDATIPGEALLSSNLVEVTVTPFEVVIEYPKLYVSSDQNAWAFDDQYLLYSVNDNNIFEGYMYMANGTDVCKFKLSTQPNWDSADAIIGDPDVSGITGTLQVGNWGGNNIIITDAPGFYKIEANITALTYRVTKTELAITGDFNSWAFANMTYDQTTEFWSFTADFTVGGFKFIANQDWGFTLGDEGADGILDKGTDGNNIQITEAGNYTVTLDLSKALYTYKIVKN